MQTKLGESVTSISGVGDSVAKKFKILGIETVGGLINYYPRRYDDYSEVSRIASIKPGNAVTILAEVKQVKGRYVRRGMHITEAIVSDESGSIRLVWFNQPYRESAIKSNQNYFISGQFELSRQKLAIMNPSMELESAFPVNTARIVPVYRETKGLKSATIRKALAQVRELINALPETLPMPIVKDNSLISHADAIMGLHFPNDALHLGASRERLSFEELFAISLAGLLNKKQFATYSGVPIKFNEAVARQFVDSLGFDLTNAQRKVVWQIYKDLQDTKPMNRLVEGDVGSGKTIVATMASAMALSAGYQVALMAPTEILARQHADTVHRLLEPLGLSKRVVLVLGSMKDSQKRKAHQAIANGSGGMIIGTHALIASRVDIHHLGLVIIDEQHRFGVGQRETLLKKAGKMPHVLTMTATPIPRTLALTLYGELDISILDEMPPGRTRIQTSIVSANSRAPMYEHIRSELDAGRQVFVVCPLISESETLNVLSAEKVYEELSTKKLKDYRVGLLHGKMKSDDKDRIMSEFVSGELQVLVSTTVVEVGVDVPNATVMMVEGPERFGLAQIHQLRGRVGRGDYPGYCYLIMSDSKAPTRRLRALESSSDGFKLAELDLEIRGPGAIYGHMQSGQLDLRIANLSDARLINRVRQAAQQFIDKKFKIKNYPALDHHVSQYRTITNLN